MGAIIALFAAGGALAGLGQYHLLRAALRDGFGKQSLTPLAGKLLVCRELSLVRLDLFPAEQRDFRQQRRGDQNALVWMRVGVTLHHGVNRSQLVRRLTLERAEDTLGNASRALSFLDNRTPGRVE